MQLLNNRIEVKQKSRLKSSDFVGNQEKKSSLKEKLTAF